MSRIKIPVLILIALLISALACVTLTGAPFKQEPGSIQQSAAKTEPAATAAPPPVATVVLQPATAGLTLGKPDAPAKIEVFEDFQCPACLKFSQNIEPLVLKELVDTGKASYTFHHFPFLDTGNPAQESHQAANASMCASEQGKFWEYKTMVFDHWAGENAGAYSDENLTSFAGSLNLNMDAFNACFKENRYKDLIEADIKNGDGMGVQGTPSVFVNGTLLTPGYIPAFDDIKNAVDAAQP